MYAALRHQRLTSGIGLNSFGYRKDIDGLRAIAVLGVVAFHINSSLVPGGFAGVDIFFVISGFLITSLIRVEVAAGTFNLSNFYARRIRRIVPALAVVVVATLMVGQLILIPTHFNELARSAIASMISAANIFFTYFVDTGYFADSSLTKPLLHIWSLGVEEQFYFVWPILAAFLISLRLGKIKLFSLVAAGTLALVLLSEWLIEVDANFAYYMLPSRAFELLIGAALALLPVSVDRPKNRAILVASALGGVGLIVLSYAVIGEKQPFPGFYAVPATLGAGLLIFSGASGETLVSRILSLAPVRWIGLISYSLYLWHWPVMAYVRYLVGEPNVPVQLAALVVMLALSLLTYFLIEIPFRRTKLSRTKVYGFYFALPTVVIAALSISVISTGGLGLSTFNTDYRRAVAELTQAQQAAYRYDFVCQKQLLTAADLSNPKCIVNGTGAEPRILLWGDSNAAHYVGVLREIAVKHGFSFRSLAHTNCPPILENGWQYIGERRVDKCRRSLETVIPRLDSFDTIIIGGSWRNLSNANPAVLDALDRTIENLTRRGKEVIVLGVIPGMPGYDRYCEVKKLKFPALDCTNGVSRQVSDYDAVNLALANIVQRYPSAYYFDVYSVICPEGLCKPYLEGKPLYYDPGHFSMTGSTIVGRHLIEENLVPGFFGQLHGE